MIEKVVLVDKYDNAIGTMEKLEAHQKAILHRAFSVFIFNNKNEMLLQQRAVNKYHSASLWTNACCSHPYPNETPKNAAIRRLQEEMGFETNVEKAFEFTYKATFNNGLTEHEYDHVFVGNYDGIIMPNNLEVQNYCYKNVLEILDEIKIQPQKYTAWFVIALPKLLAWLQKK